MRDAHLDAESIDATVERVLEHARVPGAALAIVLGGRTVLAKGYGYRDVGKRLPMMADTVYPIASTTKAINATLLGLLVDEGRLQWDVPVQTYLPSFRLCDPLASAQVTLRDLVVMRTGLPRHDWLWLENPITRAEQVERLRCLDCSAPFREKFQYCNLSVTAAGHIAEVVTGRTWEDLVEEGILKRLGMSDTGVAEKFAERTTLSYHESSRREQVLTRRLASEVAAPSGGALHSTVRDMALWISFNLSGADRDGRPLLDDRTMAQIQSPQIIVGADPSAPTPGALYAMGWYVDTVRGFRRVSHAGYLYDVDSEVVFFPSESIGMVAFTNFGPPGMAKVINARVFDCIAGFEPERRLEEDLAQYEKKVADNAARIAQLPHVRGTSPSHGVLQYAGIYAHPAYGRIEISVDEAGLCLRRHTLMLRLEHWHYDVWRVAPNDLFQIHRQHAFDGASRLVFQTSADGLIGSFNLQLEPAVAPIRFTREAEARCLL